MSNPARINVLLVKVASIGDVLATSPLPRKLKEYNSDIDVTHLVMKNCKFVTANNPFVKEQCVMEFLPSKNIATDFVTIIKAILILRKKKIDVAFVFHRNILFQTMCWLAGIKKIYGFSSPFNPYYLAHLPYSYNVNRTIQEFDLLRLGGFDLKDPHSLEFFPEIIDLPPPIHKLLPKEYIACNPGGGNLHSSADNRMWPIEYFSDLINRSPLPFVILGYGKSDQERVSKLSKLVEPQRMINMVGKTSFSETALILQRAALYVGNDSSLMFLSAAMGAKTLGLYGPTQVEAANPIGVQQYAIRSESSCSPCYNPYDGINGRMYTCKNNICMQEIKVEAVFCKMIELLYRKDGNL